MEAVFAEAENMGWGAGVEGLVVVKVLAVGVDRQVGQGLGNGRFGSDGADSELPPALNLVFDLLVRYALDFDEDFVVEFVEPWLLCNVVDVIEWLVEEVAVPLFFHDLDHHLLVFLVGANFERDNDGQGVPLERGFADGDADFAEADYGGHGAVMVDDGLTVEFVLLGARGGPGSASDEVSRIEGGRAFSRF